MSGAARGLGQLAAYGLGYALFANGPLGGAIASTLFQLLAPPPRNYPLPYSSRMSDLGTVGTEIGTPIFRVYGTMPLVGTVIDCGTNGQGVPAAIEEVITYVPNPEPQESGKGPSQPLNQQNPIYRYFMTSAFLLCEGTRYVDQIIQEDTQGRRVIYDRWKPGQPTVGSDDWYSLWTDIATNESAYVNGSGIQLTPEYSGGELIAELSDSLRLYHGTERQMADTALESIHTHVPAYRGYCYVMFNHYGPLHGQTKFTFVTRSNTRSRVEIIERELNLANVPSSRIALNSMAGDVMGCAISQVQPAADMIQKLSALVYHDISFVNGAFRDISRLNPTYWQLQLGDLGAEVASEGGAQANTKTDIESHNKFNRVTTMRLRFVDYDLNYQPNEAVSTMDDVQHENETSIDLTIVGHLADFVKLVDIMHNELNAQDGVEKFSLLPDEKIRIAQGNAIIYPDPAGTRVVRVLAQDLATKGALTMTGCPYDPGVYGIYRTFNVAAPLDRPTVPIYQVPNYYLGDLPAILSTMMDTPGIVMGVGTPLEQPWDGAAVVAANGEFDDVGTRIRATLGVLNADLSYDDSQLGSLQDIIIRITLDGYGALASTDTAHLRAGANLLAINNLLINFLDATPVFGQPFQFDLRYILFGRYGTDWIQAVAASGSKIMKLTDENGNRDSAVRFAPLSMSSLRSSLNLSVYASLDPTKTTGAVAYTPMGNNLTPARVRAIRKESDGAGGYNVIFHGGTRNFDSITAFWKAGIGPLESDGRKFTIQLKNGSTVVNTRTATIPAHPATMTYTHSELMSYFGSIPDPLTGTIYQEGTYLRGHGYDFSI